MNLVELKPLLPADVIFDLRYATPDNIAAKILYEKPIAKLDEVAARQLVGVAKALGEQSMRMVIWDAYRPPEIHQQLLAANSDPRYVLDDSNHPKGLAVDVTLARLDGQYFDMGSDFDDFSPRAHVDAEGLTRQQADNRQLLRAVMSQAGFRQWPYEWWHFDYLKDEPAA